MDRGKRVAVIGALWVAADAEPAAGPVEFETVMVTATNSVSMVAAETTEAEQPQSLDDTLKALPNVELFSGPRRLGEKANIRGFSDERIVATLDGARQNFSIDRQGRFVLEPDLPIELSHPPRRWADDVEGGGAFAAVRVIPIRRWDRCIACLLLALVGPVQSAQVVDAMGQEVAVTDASRIVTVGGELTELVYALGAGERLAGVDTTSTWPEAARQLPQVGYMRNLSAEGILSLSPTLVLATTNAGPPEVLAQLRLAGATLVVLPARPTADGALLKVRAVGEALDREVEAAVLARQIEEDLSQAQVRVRKLSTRPRVLFLMGMTQGAPIAAGADTAAQAIIEFAGGVNALSGFRDYRPVSPEALAAAEIDVVLVPRHALEALSGREGVLQQPGLALTRAAREQRLVVMDGLYLLGFGPRLGQAVQDLARLLHPQAFTAGQSHDRAR